MASMKPCTDPRICGVQNHRPGTPCRAEAAKKSRPSSSGVFDAYPPSSSQASSISENEYGSLTVNESNGNWGSSTFELDQDTYDGLPEIDSDTRSAVQAIRNRDEFRQPDSSNWRGVHAAYTGEEEDTYTVLKGDKVIAFRNVNGDFVMHNTSAGISYGNNHALVHAASRLDSDGNITPDGSSREFPVREVAKESDFNDNLKRHLSGEAQDSMPSIGQDSVAFREGEVTDEGLTAAARKVLSAPKGRAVSIQGANAEELGVTSISRESNGEFSLTLHRRGSEIHLETNDSLMHLVRRAANR